MSLYGPAKRKYEICNHIQNYEKTMNKVIAAPIQGIISCCLLRFSQCWNFGVSHVTEALAMGLQVLDDCKKFRTKMP